MPNDTKQRLFVDMDGTLAVFTPVDELEMLYQKGYFLNQTPHENVVVAVREIIKNHPEIEVNILSAYLTDSPFALQEKNEWLDRHLPQIDEAHRVFVPCGSDKKEGIAGGVRPDDFLLDDYTQNLNDWQPPARGIKLLNAINHTRGSWTHDRIRYDRDPTSLAAGIVSIMKDGQEIYDNKIEREESKMPVQENSKAYHYYLIADLMTWAKNDAERSELERFDNIDALKARFDELKVMYPHNDVPTDINEQTELPYARLTVGIETEGSAADILHVRNGQNYLVDDFTRMENIINSDNALRHIAEISERIGFERVHPFVPVMGENGRVQRYERAADTTLDEYIKLLPKQYADLFLKNGQSQSHGESFLSAPIETIARLDFINNPRRQGIGGMNRASELLAQITPSIEAFNDSNNLYTTYDGAWTAANLANDFEPQIAVLQLSESEAGRAVAFMSMEELEKANITPDAANYEIAYVRNLARPIPEAEQQAACERLYEETNTTQRPQNYIGTSISMGDIVVVRNELQDIHAYYFDTVGVRQLPDNFITPELDAKIRNHMNISAERAALNEVAEWKNENGQGLKMPQAFAERREFLNAKYKPIFDFMVQRNAGLNKIAEFYETNARLLSGDEISAYLSNPNHNEGIHHVNRRAVYNAVREFETANNIENPVIDADGNYTDREFLYSAYDRYMALSHLPELEEYRSVFERSIESEVDRMGAVMENPTERDKQLFRRTELLERLAQTHYAKANGMSRAELDVMIGDGTRSAEEMRNLRRAIETYGIKAAEVQLHFHDNYTAELALDYTNGSEDNRAFVLGLPSNLDMATANYIFSQEGLNGGRITKEQAAGIAAAQYKIDDWNKADYVRRSEDVTRELAGRIVDFMENYNPALNYEKGVQGQENRRQWIDTVIADLTDGANSYLQDCPKPTLAARQEATALEQRIKDSRVDYRFHTTDYEFHAEAMRAAALNGLTGAEINEVTDTFLSHNAKGMLRTALNTAVRNHAAEQLAQRFDENTLNTELDARDDTAVEGERNAELAGYSTRAIQGAIMRQNGEWQTEQVAIESTDDYADTAFHADTVDVDKQNADGTYGKVVERYRLVALRNGHVTPIESQTYTDRQEAEVALQGIDNAIPVDYDTVIHSAAREMFTPPLSRYYDEALDIDGTAEELFTQVRNGYITNPDALRRIHEILTNPAENRNEEARYVETVLQREEANTPELAAYAQIKKDFLDGVNPDELTLRDGLTLMASREENNILLALQEYTAERSATGAFVIPYNEFLSLTPQEIEQQVNSAYAHTMVEEERPLDFEALKDKYFELEGRGTSDIFEVIDVSDDTVYLQSTSNDTHFELTTEDFLNSARELPPNEISHGESGNWVNANRLLNEAIKTQSYFRVKSAVDNAPKDADGNIDKTALLNKYRGTDTYDDLTALFNQMAEGREDKMPIQEPERNLAGETRAQEAANMSDGTFSTIMRREGIENSERYNEIEKARVYAVEYLSNADHQNEEITTAVHAYHEQQERNRRAAEATKPAPTAQENPSLTASDDGLTPKEKLQKQLTEGVQHVLNDESFKNWLSTSSRMYTNQYSFNNAILVWLQRPDATHTMGYEAWKDYGRQVQQGAKGIKIFVPLMAYEKNKGDLFRIVKANLVKQLAESSSVQKASYQLGTSSLTFTMNRNHIIGIENKGRELNISGNEEEIKRFIDRNVIGKVPTGFTVGTVFDAKDTTKEVEYLWVKRGFTKDEIVKDENGKPIKNRRGETKIVNTEARKARYQTSLDTSVVAQDPAKMERLLDSCVAASERKSVPVFFRDKADDEHLQGGAYGYFSREKTLTDESAEGMTKGFIVIDKNLELTKQCSVIMHEMGHADLHGNLDALQRQMGEEKINRSMKEIQAEAVSFGTAKQFGIETDTSSFRYLAAYTQGLDQQALQKSLEVIYKEVKALTADISAELDIRGLNLDMSEKDRASLQDKTVKTLCAKYIDLATTRDIAVCDALKEMPTLVEQNKNSPELIEILKNQREYLETQKADIEGIITGVEALKSTTDRDKQDECISCLESAATRLNQNHAAFENLTEQFVITSDMAKGGLRQDYKNSPMKTLEAMKAQYPRLAALTKPQMEYIAKSKYITSKCANLLRTNPQAFVDKACARAEVLGNYAAKNGTVVEVGFCEQWDDKPVFEGGTLCHPKIADKIVAAAEAATKAERLKEEQSGSGEYVPCSKCDITVFMPNSKGGLTALNTHVDIGDGTQTSLNDHLSAVAGRSKVKGEIVNSFTDALNEKGRYKDKIFIPSVETEKTEQTERTAQKEQDKSLPLDTWKEKIGEYRDAQAQAAEAEKENRGQEQTMPDNSHKTEREIGQ
jgi:5'(3')-deoxyribonucleotidase